MLVKVRYADNSTGTVDSSILDRLVRIKEISEIHRSSGWVSVATDPRQEPADRRRNRGTRRGSGHIIDIYV